MRNRRPAVDHSEAVARRLALLSAELDATRAVEASRAAGGEDAPHPDVVRAGLTRISGAPLAAPDPFLLPAAEREERDASSAVAGDGTDVVARPRPLPVPGRHAARRSVPHDSVPRFVLLPESVRAWQPGQVSVVLAGLLLASALACGWLLLGRGGGEVVAVTPVSGAATTSAGPAAGEQSSAAAEPRPPSGAGGTGTPAQAAEIVVDVAGKVRRPGLVVLPAGARVADAVERAGGARRGADTSSLNLARPLTDGEQVVVGVTPDAGQAAGTLPTPPTQVAPSGAGTVLISINSADQAALETLPGVGPVTASSIVEWRTTHGGFSSLEDLLEVRGIGAATLARLTPHITL